MTSIQLVFAETSPYESQEAIIEQDDQVAYFYLRGMGGRKDEMKSCWIRNLVEAPAEIDRERLTAGMPPVLPAEFCKSPAPMPRLDEKQLRVVWFENGSGASLLENDRVIATIPAFSGSEHFDGFARDCIKPSPFCAPLETSSEKLLHEVDAADRFWKSWESNESPWIKYEPIILNAYEKRFGAPIEYLAIDGGKWPPRTVAKYAWNDRIILLTVGVSICPQPKVELVFDNPNLWRRIEWGACFEQDCPAERIQQFIRYLGGQVGLPWQHLTFLSHGHSVSCDLFQATDQLPDYSSILLFSDVHCSAEQKPELPKVDGDPVNLLWCLPVYEMERKYLQETSNFSLLNELIGENDVPVIRSRPTLI